MKQIITAIFILSLASPVVSQDNGDAVELLDMSKKLYASGLYKNAISDLVKAQKLPVVEDSILFEVTLLKGLSFNKSGDGQNAEKALRNAVDIATSIGDVNLIARSYIELIRFFTSDENLNTKLADQYLYKADEISDNLIPELKGRLYIVKGQTFFREQQIDSAIIYLDKALIASDNIDVGEVLLMLGDIYQFKGEAYRAIDHYLKGYEAAKADNQLSRLTDFTSRLSNLYFAVGDLEKANEFQRNYIEYKEQLYDEEVKTKIEALELQNQMDQNDQLFEIRKEEELKQEKLRQRSALISTFLIFFVTMCGLFLFYISRVRLKKMNANLSRVNAQLYDTLKEQEAMAGIVAHDLKAPFNKIRGFLHLVELTGKLSKEQKEYIQMAEGVISQSFRLITDIIDISSYEQSKEIKKEIVEVNHVLESMVNQYKQVSEEKDITIFLDLHDNIRAYSNEDYLSRIFDNLISNAIKFSPKGKSIYITTGKSAGVPFVKIKDEGPGFTENDKKEIFKKFRKLSAKPTAGEESTGLGLSIIKTLTERLNLDISLKSSEGHGAEFTIKFKRNMPKMELV